MSKPAPQEPITPASLIEGSNLPRLYINGFSIAGTDGDCVAVLMVNGMPQLTLNMSFTVAKSLGIAIGQIVTALETASGRPIMTTNDVSELMKPFKNQPGSPV